jgi:hypothetical protein
VAAEREPAANDANDANIRVIGVIRGWFPIAFV